MALHLALSMTIVTGVSLSLGWDYPKWSMLAVAFCVLATGGESILKGLYRLTGTVIGLIVALVFMSLYLDFRFSYYLAVMIWLTICCWMMIDSRSWYIWLLAGFVVPLLTYYAQGNPASAFEDAMVRLQQTSLGVIGFSLVSTFILPRHTSAGFPGDIASQIEALRERFSNIADHYAQTKLHKVDDADSEKEAKGASQPLTQQLARLDAAALEEPRMLPVKKNWKHLLCDIERLSHQLTRWRLGFAEISEAAGEATDLPDISTVCSEIDRRLGAAASLLNGEDGETTLQRVSIPQAPVDESDPFLSGAIALSLRNLREIEKISTAVLQDVTAIRNDIRDTKRPELRDVGHPKSLIPDPDKLTALLRIGVSFTIAFWLVIFSPGISSPGMVIILTSSVGLFICNNPTAPLGATFIAGILSVCVTGLLHIFIMPKLASYLGLGIMLFVYTFVMAWLFHAPKMTVPRFFSIGFMTLIIQLDNFNQSYDFLYIANFGVAFSLPILIVLCTSRFPVNMTAPAVFDRYYRRYVSSTIWLLHEFAKDHGHPINWWRRELRKYHLRQVLRLPGKLRPWIDGLPDVADKEDIGRFVGELEKMSHRLDEMARRHDWTHSRHVAEVFDAELNDWARSIEEASQNLREAPRMLDLAALDARLQRRIERLSADAQQVLEEGENLEPPGALQISLLQELSIFRGVSRGLQSVARAAQQIDWPVLRETRF